MKRNETGYLKALQSFSRPARQLWEVRWFDGQDFSFEFKGEDAIHRYFDATECVIFLLRMALETLQLDLREEAHYLARYDEVVRAVNERYEVPGPVLSNLVRFAYQNQGRIAQKRRKQYEGRIDPRVLEYIETLLTKPVNGVDDPGSPST